MELCRDFLNGTKVQLAESPARNYSEWNVLSCARERKRWACKLSPTLKPTVIIVDNDASVRRALRMQLSIAGFNVRVFASAKEFFAGKSATANTCLLLDIYMPGMTGVDLWEQLAAAGGQMPTVLISGRDDEQTRKLARKAQGAPCLFKPFDQAALMRAIHKAMRGRVKSNR